MHLISACHFRHFKVSFTKFKKYIIFLREYQLLQIQKEIVCLWCDWACAVLPAKISHKGKSFHSNTPSSDVSLLVVNLSFPPNPRYTFRQMRSKELEDLTLRHTGCGFRYRCSLVRSEWRHVLSLWLSPF